MSDWIILQQDAAAEAPAGIDSALAGIMRRRQVCDADMEDFLSPRPRLTYDPFLLPDMEEAVGLILDACEKGEKICVYGDYDADGVTSTALLVGVLRLISSNISYYVPSRFVDGYGLNMSSVKKVADTGASLLITVDCGSTSAEEIACAKELGMKVIVTDHHTPDESLDLGCLFINPKRAGSLYPCSRLSGCGVAFKLAQALQRTLAAKGDCRFTRSFLNDQLDLVAISTVADVVPLLDENRTLVKYGLDFINRRKRPGLKTLLEVLDFGDKPIDSDRIAYLIAPNINALGRMGSAALGVELFCGVKADGSPCEDLLSAAVAMKEMNLQRKAEQEKTCAICSKALEEGGCGELFPVILAEGAHEGVAGIVAGNIKEKLYRPVCIVTPSEGGLLKGTGRSVPGINIYELLGTQSRLFTRYGGHAGACGLTMEPQGLEELRCGLQEQMKLLLEKDPGLLTEKLLIEKELSPEEKSLEFAKKLQLLEPYGEGNLRPLFCVSSASVSCLRRMGQEGQHLRFTVTSGDGVPVDCVLFRRADDFFGLLSESPSVSVCGELTVNGFGGCEKLQMIVRDIKGA
ncbi:MAG: single-stranded-DNA-specific exonuclease RecJ [Firmicutes bacterium]|nr:single-stranded-DNA-specific exonuclease RecJ [Bacillota bacterium]